MTFSRICYASFLISIIPLTAGIAIFSKKKWRSAVLTAIVVLIAAILTIPVLKGGFIEYRFDRLSQGINTRLHHWENAIQKMDATSSTVLFGMGPGTYPETYFKKPDGIKPGYYQFISQDKNVFLRLFPGDSLYFGQMISPKHDVPYLLTFDARVSTNKGRLTVPICEKFILYSFKCNWKTIDIVTKKNTWGHYKNFYPGFKLGRGRIYQKRPVEFTLYNGNRNAIIDIDNVKLTDIDGRNIIKNGNFNHGSDFWCFSTDNHLPWHIKNIWVNHFFEMGITGLIVFTFFALFVLLHMIQGIIKKDLFSLILFSSFCGFFVVGLVESLFDSPRILFLFYFISFLSIFYSNVENQNNFKT